MAGMVDEVSGVWVLRQAFGGGLDVQGFEGSQEAARALIWRALLDDPEARTLQAMRAALRRQLDESEALLLAQVAAHWFDGDVDVDDLDVDGPGAVVRVSHGVDNV